MGSERKRPIFPRSLAIGIASIVVGYLAFNVAVARVLDASQVVDSQVVQAAMQQGLMAFISVAAISAFGLHRVVH
ncbi:hypothetical protein [Amycolatopsis antarctica]|uniref:hypothetical protein n=1 Tax=Amycolatopsis antarctica TaxID=1854586 RepID=UPI001055B4B8|nr:hypothetical protein [Amycolatopsis antarctica]